MADSSHGYGNIAASFGRRYRHGLSIVSALESQIRELTALAEVYPSTDEFVVEKASCMTAQAVIDGALPIVKAVPIRASVKVSLSSGTAQAELRVTLPLDYPEQSPAQVTCNCKQLSPAALAEVNAAVSRVAADAAAARRGALLELCQALQQEAERRLTEPVADKTTSRSPRAASNGASEAPPASTVRRSCTHSRGHAPPLESTS